jgi:O-antigen/teichoic acid export membrane protein
MQLKFLRYGIPLFLSGISMWTLNYSDRFILPNFVSTQDLGVYVLAYQIGAISAQVLTTPIWTQFQGIVSKEFNKGNIDRCQQIFSFSITVICLLGMPMVVGLYVMSKDILLLFAPPGFSGGADVIPLEAIGYLFHIAASFFEVGLGLYHKQKIITLTSVLILMFNGVFNTFV